MENKNILIITQYFFPENFKSNDIAFELATMGYKIDVITGIPNYPEGKYYKGYSVFRKRIEKIKGVLIYRCLLIPRGRNNKILLSCNYISYIIFASLYSFILSLNKKYKVIIVHAPSPIFQCIPAILSKIVNKTKILLWVLDLWPDALKTGAGLKNPIVLNIFKYFVKIIYIYSDKILISSKGFKSLILKNGGRNNKIIYFPNWSNDYYSKHEEKDKNKNEKILNIMIAGNIGKSQDMETIADAVKELKYEAIKWIIVGDGSKKKWFEKYIHNNNLENMVVFLGKINNEKMSDVYSIADVLIISLRAGFDHLKRVVPARIQSYLSTGKPIICVADGEVQKIIKEAQCGFIAKAGDAIELENIIKEKIMKLSEFEMQNIGNNGKKYYEKYFTKNKCISHLIDIIEE